MSRPKSRPPANASSADQDAGSDSVTATGKSKHRSRSAKSGNKSDDRGSYSVAQLAAFSAVVLVAALLAGPLLRALLRQAAASYLGVDLQSLQPLAVPSMVHSDESVSVGQAHEPSTIADDIPDDAVWVDSPNGVGRPVGSNYVCRHDYQVQILRQDPLIIFVQNFLQPGEANHIMNATALEMKRSGLQTSEGVQYDDKVRTSTTAWIGYETDQVTRCLLDRIVHFTNLPENDIEPLQVIRYQPGQEYKPHYDFMRTDGMVMADPWVREKGQRWATMIIYLNRPKSGGATTFPKLGISVPPVKNSALFWLNLDRDGLEDWRTEHAGEPVEGGEKWAMNVWPHRMTTPIYQRIQRLLADEQGAEQDPNYVRQVTGDLTAERGPDYGS